MLNVIDNHEICMCLAVIQTNVRIDALRQERSKLAAIQYIFIEVAPLHFFINLNLLICSRERTTTSCCIVSKYENILSFLSTCPGADK